MADEAGARSRRASSSEGFFDGAAHRRELPAVYNHYLRCSSRPGYDATHEALAGAAAAALHHLVPDRRLPRRQRLLRRDARCWSRARRARPPTALAFCLARRRGEPGAPRSRRPDVAGEPGVHARARLLRRCRRLRRRSTTLPAERPHGLRRHERRCGAARARPRALAATSCAYSCSVGGTHWQALGGGKGLPGPRPVLFFAPAQVKKRVAEWGASGLRAAPRVGLARLHRACRRCSQHAVAAGRRRPRARGGAVDLLRRFSTAASPRRKAGCWRCDRQARSGGACASLAPQAPARGAMPVAGAAPSEGRDDERADCADGELVRPLADLAAWTSSLPPRRDPGAARDRRGARRVARERGAHRCEQHRRDDRRRSADDAEGARATSSDHRSRSVVTDARDRHRGAGDDGHPAVLPRLRRADLGRGPARRLRPRRWPACNASCGARIAVRASRSPSRCIAPTRTRPPSTLPPCCTNSPRCCSGATRRSWRCASARCRTPIRRCARASLNERVLRIELDELQQALVAAWRLPSLLAETAHEPQAGQTGVARRRARLATGAAHRGRLGQRGDSRRRRESGGVAQPVARGSACAVDGDRRRLVAAGVGGASARLRAGIVDLSPNGRGVVAAIGRASARRRDDRSTSSNTAGCSTICTCGVTAR